MNKHTLDVEHHARLARLANAHDKATAAASNLRNAAETAHSSCSVELLKRRYRLECLQRTQANCEAQADPLKYHLNVGKILMRYYDISEGMAQEGVSVAPEEPCNSILSYFQKKVPSPDAPTVASVGSDTKAGLLEAYMSATAEGGAGGFASGNVCTSCGSCNTIVYPLESLRVCNDCDVSVSVILDTDRQHARDGKDGSFVFKRTSHLIEWLNASSGRENTVIPPEVFGNILVELKKRKITNLATVSLSQIRAILKKLRLSKYYEHTSFIMSQLNGKPTKPFDHALEESIKKMFVQIQAPFVKFAPHDRKNFLSYSYVLHKFCELLGRDEFLDRFPLLKSRDKLYVQDKIWRNICTELNWEFIPSI
jgi:hypothetical protein